MLKIITIILLISFNANASQKDYDKFVVGLKKELIKKGADKDLVEEVYETNFYKPKPEAVKADKKQAEFKFTSNDYLTKLINDYRLKKAKEQYKKKQKLLKKVYDKYGIQPEILTAFWAIESNFGQNKGSFYAFEALSQLAYDKRRRTFFKNQLYYLFKVVEDNDLDPKDVKSSWAGAMGHYQFMPSTWYSYGKGDIVNDYKDAVYSAGNYLNKEGWQKGMPWGQEITLPRNFNKKLLGRNIKKTVKEWKKLGIKTTLADNLRASIIAPDGVKGNAYITLKNYDVIMRWNRSLNYALAIGILSDYIKSGENLEPFKSPAQRKEDVKKVQKHINKKNIAKLKIDGILGKNTKKALKSLQKSLKLKENGKITQNLLNKIK